MAKQENSTLKRSRVLPLAVLGLLVVYAVSIAYPTGARIISLQEAALENAGLLCGMCAKADNGQNPIPQVCSEQTAAGPVYQPGEEHAAENCCTRACQKTGSDRCQERCLRVAQ